MFGEGPQLPVGQWVQLRPVMGEQQHMGLLLPLLYTFPLGAEVTEEILSRFNDYINLGQIVRELSTLQS